MSDPLVVDFNHNNSSIVFDNNNNPLRHYTLGNSAENPPWKLPSFRSKWERIPAPHIKGMNFFFTLNIDTNVAWYKNNKVVQIPRVLNLMSKLKRQLLISKYVIIYEWGEKGKQCGKLHYHGFIKTKKKNEVLDLFKKEFSANLRTAHRAIHLNHIKSVDDRSRMLNYLKKENQNKEKCLYWE